MGIFSRSVRAPAFREVDQAEPSEMTPSDEEEPDKSSCSDGEDAAQLISAFCQHYPTTRLEPTVHELDCLWAKCSTLKSAAVSRAIADQLTPECCDHEWQPQLRALHILLDFYVRGETGRKVVRKVMASTSELLNHLAVEGSECEFDASRLILLRQLTDVMRPGEDIRIAYKGGIISFLAEPQALDRTPDSASHCPVSEPGAAVPYAGAHDEAAAEWLSGKGPDIDNITPSQPTASSPSRTTTCLSAQSAPVPNSTYDEGSNPGRPPSGSGTLPPPEPAPASGSTHDKTLELLEESVGSWPNVPADGDSLGLVPRLTPCCDFRARVVHDAGAAPRKVAPACWVRPLRQQMPFIALGVESEMPIAPDPFSTLDHHVNSLKLKL